MKYSLIIASFTVEARPYELVTLLAGRLRYWLDETPYPFRFWNLAYKIVGLLFNQIMHIFV